MSARRRRAALSAVGALVAPLFCAALASSGTSDLHRTILLLLALAWLVIAGTSVVNVVRTEPPAAPPTAPPEVDPDEST
jgi:hypothetical protein